MWGLPVALKGSTVCTASVYVLIICNRRVRQVRAGLGHGSYKGQGKMGWGTVTHLPGAALMQGHTLVPLVDMVWVLAQQDAVKE